MGTACLNPPSPDTRPSLPYEARIANATLSSLSISHSFTSPSGSHFPLSSLHTQNLARTSASQLGERLVAEVVSVEAAAAGGRAAALLVDLRDDGRAGVLQLLELLVEVLLLGVLVVIEPLVDLFERLLDGLLVVAADLVGDALLRVAERALHREEVVLETVAALDLLAHLLVLLGELLGLGHEVLDLLGRQPALAAGDRNRLRDARALVGRAHVQDAVGVNLESHLDLWHAARRGRQPLQLEVAEARVVRGERSLALEDPDVDRGLVVLVRREDLRLLGRDDGVARDELGHHAADGLNAEGERRHIEHDQLVEGLVLGAAEDGPSSPC